MNPNQETNDAADVQAVRDLQSAYSEVQREMGGVIVGLDEVIAQTFVTLICRGHCILEGVPGLAKTKLISTLASLMDLDFKRIQFTPDLMPGDITGSDVLEEDRTTGGRVFRFIQGPLFGNVILADEINRTPPKTQSALLEAMEERQLTVAGKTYPLPDPFFVLATQNPIEQEGTYPMPEAQLDRFMMKITLGYPSAEEEVEIMKRAATEYSFKTKAVMDAETIFKLQKLVRRLPTADHVYEYASNLTRSTRPNEPGASDYTRQMISWGAGPRASIFLILAAKAHAILMGRVHATEDDVRAMAHPIMRHRIMPTFNAQAEGLTTDHIVTQLMS